MCATQNATWDTQTHTYTHSRTHLLASSPLSSPPPPPAQTFLPLLVLGGVFSAVFLATGNLLPTVVAHSLWNIFVLANLMWRPS